MKKGLLIVWIFERFSYPPKQWRMRTLSWAINRHQDPIKHKIGVFDDSAIRFDCIRTCYTQSPSLRFIASNVYMMDIKTHISYSLPLNRKYGNLTLKVWYNLRETDHGLYGQRVFIIKKRGFLFNKACLTKFRAPGDLTLGRLRVRLKMRFNILRHQ